MIDKTFLETEYVTKNRHASDIAQEIGLSDTQVRYWLKFHNIPIKPRGARYNTKDLTGQRFGKCVVIQQVQGDGHASVWQCRCDCGKIKTIKGPCLRRGEIKSCGHCCPPYNWKGYGEIGGLYFHSLQKNAMKRGYAFNLTIEQIWELFLKQNRKCALSGQEIFFKRHPQHKHNQTASLDRIDNLQDYTIENVQWIHKDLNRIKREYQQPYFLLLVKQVYEHRGLSVLS